MKNYQLSEKAEYKKEGLLELLNEVKNLSDNDKNKLILITDYYTELCVSHFEILIAERNRFEALNRQDFLLLDTGTTGYDLLKPLKEARVKRFCPSFSH